MKERPILFNGAMVRALLDGTKTQTRRVVKPQPDFLGSQGSPYTPFNTKAPGLHVPIPCPYGQPGERLWVREAWAHTKVFQAGCDEWVVYREGDNRTDYGGPWKPSIHMPRSHSRIILEIVSVRVERLTSISEVDALAEGVSSMRTKEWDFEHFPVWRTAFEEARVRGEKPPVGPHPSEAFRALWESINGPGSWDAAPWVWVVEFKRVTPPEN